MPIGQYIRYAAILTASLIILAACGGGTREAVSQPAVPPTRTVEPTMTVEPTPEPTGARLDALDTGQVVAPDDRRYSLRVPEFWIHRASPPDEIAYRESGGTPTDTGYAYTITRELLGDDITSVDEYADSARETIEDQSEGLETLSVAPVQVADIQGVRWVYKVNDVSGPMLVHRVYVVDGRTGFILTGSAPIDGDTRAASELFNAIAGSLTFPRG